MEREREGREEEEPLDKSKEEEKYDPVGEIDAKFEAFKQGYRNLFQQFAERLAEAFVSPEERMRRLNTESIHPKSVSISQAAQIVREAKNIVLLTGAGISAGSGIPTFRGAKGLYTKKTKEGDAMDPTDMLTKSFFDQDPKGIPRGSLKCTGMCSTCDVRRRNARRPSTPAPRGRK